MCPYLVPNELVKIYGITSSTDVTQLASQMFDPLRQDWKWCLDINLNINYILDRPTIVHIYQTVTDGGEISDGDFSRLIRQMGRPDFDQSKWEQIKHAFGIGTQQAMNQTGTCPGPATCAMKVGPAVVSDPVA